MLAFVDIMSRERKASSRSNRKFEKTQETKRGGRHAGEESVWQGNADAELQTRRETEWKACPLAGRLPHLITRAITNGVPKRGTAFRESAVKRGGVLQTQREEDPVVKWDVPLEKKSTVLEQLRPAKGAGL